MKASPRYFSTSSDGSLTIWVPKLDEYYHSIHGAVTESQHIFIDAGLKAIDKEELSILEVGLGTALNARLTLEQKGSKTINYFALDKFPLTAEEIEEIKALGYEKEAEILKARQGNPTHIETGFTFELSTADLRDFSITQPTFDLIYFDAFAPSAQPELWSEKVFQSMYNALLPGGALVTYCAKGVVKRTMIAVGFEVEALPGPPRKREMTRAWKR
ncbi:MAG TPA: SAM-dependent methyltransferase [Cryomorphaceae bacterium]|nr:SAM-dependent methyltransferase [Cryomorphaceae bacterium]|tara:strand:+ start:497 stop:1144 length:648 start_codon:yes stop_codon:yes gene_type:complete